MKRIDRDHGIDIPAFMLKDTASAEQSLWVAVLDCLFTDLKKSVRQYAKDRLAETIEPGKRFCDPSSLRYFWDHIETPWFWEYCEMGNLDPEKMYNAIKRHLKTVDYRPPDNYKENANRRTYDHSLSLFRGAGAVSRQRSKARKRAWRY